jgi:hypothetical protein
VASKLCCLKSGQVVRHRQWLGHFPRRPAVGKVQYWIINCFVLIVAIGTPVSRDCYFKRFELPHYLTLRRSRGFWAWQLKVLWIALSNLSASVCPCDSKVCSVEMLCYALSWLRN